MRWVAVVVLGLAAPLGAWQDRASLGQWIWTDADARIFVQSRAAVPALEPGVWVATIGFADGVVGQRLARSPRLAADAGVTAVVRIDDSFHAAWSALDDATLAAALATRLRALRTHLDAAGAPIAAIQLDYDCPVRRLPRWAAVLRTLRIGPLAGVPVWITSLVAHLQSPEYGVWFHDAVDGHVLQLFDVGDAPGVTPAEVVALCDRAALPFRIGLGAFERVAAGGGTTRHARWWRAVQRPESAWYLGVWVFPAGRPWLAAWQEATR